MVPSDISMTTSYRLSVVTMSLSAAAVLNAMLLHVVANCGQGANDMVTIDIL